MWVKPGHTPDRPKPPAESGERLAVFPRGEGSELRVTLAEFNGNPFISLRVWEQNQAGDWWPVKGKGCSVRLSEAGGLAEALARVASEPATPPATGRGRPAPAGRRGGSSWTPPGPRPTAPATAEGFDEFA